MLRVVRKMMRETKRRRGGKEGVRCRKIVYGRKVLKEKREERRKK